MRKRTLSVQTTAIPHYSVSVYIRERSAQQSMSFRGVGQFTLAPGFQVRWGVVFDAAFGDVGPQYIGAHPAIAFSEIIAFDQSKELTVDGKFDYGVTLWNSGSSTTDFGLQGGQVANQFTGSEVFTLAPGAQAGIITTFGNGDDQGPLFITAYPGNPGSELVASGPRDAQRDFDKQAEKQKGDLEGASVMLFH